MRRGRRQRNSIQHSFYETYVSDLLTNFMCNINTKIRHQKDEKFATTNDSREILLLKLPRLSLVLLFIRIFSLLQQYHNTFLLSTETQIYCAER